MIQRPTGADMPVYASLSTMRQQPTQDEIANGVIPLDTLPANWWNWLWNTITRAQNDLQYNDEVIFTEINNVLTAGGITPNPTADAQATHDQLIRAINIIKNAVATTATLGVVKSSDTGTDGTVRVNTGGTMNVNGFGDLATLHTVDKDTVTGAINEVHDEMDALNTNLMQEIQNEASEIRGEIGTLSSLTTTAKTNLVAAINEVQSEVNTNKTAIGTLSSLTTTAKNNLVAAVNEVQSEVNTAKSTADTNKTAIGTLSSLTTSNKSNVVAAINELQSEVNTVAGVLQNIGIHTPLINYVSLHKYRSSRLEINGVIAIIACIARAPNSPNDPEHIDLNTRSGDLAISIEHSITGSRLPVLIVRQTFSISVAYSMGNYSYGFVNVRTIKTKDTVNWLANIVRNTLGGGVPDLTEYTNLSILCTISDMRITNTKSGESIFYQGALRNISDDLANTVYYLGPANSDIMSCDITLTWRIPMAAV